MPTIAEDPLTAQEEYIGPVEYVTDGTWAWLNIVAYHVEKYDLVLPEEFLSHGASVGWVVDVP